MNERHEAVLRAIRGMSPSNSVLRHGKSVHVCRPPLHFKAVREFTLSAENIGPCFIGMSGANLTISVQLETTIRKAELEVSLSDTRRKKRKRDTAADRADVTIAPLRQRAIATFGERNTAVEHGLEQSKTTITRILSTLRGAHGEDVVESCALTMNNRAHGAANANANATPHEPSPTTTTANLPNPATAPLFVIACRITSGVAVRLRDLIEAFEPCFQDGVLTTRSDAFGADFKLPSNEAGSLLEEEGKSSLFAFASVPEGAKLTASSL